MAIAEVVAYKLPNDDVVCDDPLCLIEYVALMEVAKPMTRKDVYERQCELDDEWARCVFCEEILEGARS